MAALLRDEDIVNLVKQSPAGISAAQLIQLLLATGSSERQIVNALQRALERGKVDFSPDALLIA